MNIIKYTIVIAIIICFSGIGVRSQDGWWPYNTPRDSVRILTDLRKTAKLFYESKDTVVIHQLESLYKESIAAHYHYGAVMALEVMGGYYYYQDDYVSAIKSAKQAVEYAKAYNIQHIIPDLENNLALAYQSNRDYVDAMHHFSKALEYMEQNTTLQATSNEKATLYLNIATLLSNIGNQDSSVLLYLSRAEKENVSKKMARARILLLKSNAIFNLHTNKKKGWQEVKQYYEEALAIAYSERSQKMETDILSRMSSVTLKALQFNESLQYSNRALAYSNISILDQISCNLHKGLAGYGLKQYGMSTAAFLKAEQLANKYDGAKNLIYEIKEKIYNGLAYVYTDIGDYKRANRFFRLSSICKDSTIRLVLDNRVQGLETKYEVTKRDKELVEKELLITQQNAALQQRNMIIYLVLGGISALSGFMLVYIRNRRRAEKQQREVAVWRASLEGEETERKRIAKELHDNIGGTLSTVKMWFQTISDRETLIHTRQEYGEALGLLDMALTEVRNTAHHLMPELLLRHGLADAVRIFCSNVSRATGMEIDYRYLGYIGNMDKSIALIIYRTIQELVQNVVKHSGANHVLVQLSMHNTELSLTVEDNGKGMDVEKLSHRDGMGLESVRNSIEKLGGKISISSEPGSGTTVDIDLDLATSISDGDG